LHKKESPSFEFGGRETFFVPIKLFFKERRFDGGRGTEFYTFGIDNWRKITFSDQSIPEIMKDERVPAETLYNILDNKEEISEELKELIKQTAKRSTFC
jgi:hypothetical protein